MKPFNYGVSGFVGDYLITKMRISASDFVDVEKHLKSNCIQYTIQMRTNKWLKNGQISRNVHFVAAFHSMQLNQVKVILRKNKIKRIENEISQLKLF